MKYFKKEYIYYLTALIEKNFPGVPKTNVQFLAIFNNMPASEEIDIIGKIERKYKNRVNCFSLILKRYKHKSQSGIAARYYMKQRIFCKKENGLLNKNFFLVMQDGRLVHIQDYFNLSDMVFTIEKKINPAKTYADYAISKENLECKISTKINAGNLRLYDLNAGEELLILLALLSGGKNPGKPLRELNFDELCDLFPEIRGCDVLLLDCAGIKLEPRQEIAIIDIYPEITRKKYSRFCHISLEEEGYIISREKERGELLEDKEGLFSI